MYSLVFDSRRTAPAAGNERDVAIGKNLVPDIVLAVFRQSVDAVQRVVSELGVILPYLARSSHHRDSATVSQHASVRIAHDFRCGIKKGVCGIGGAQILGAKLPSRQFLTFNRSISETGLEILLSQFINSIVLPHIVEEVRAGDHVILPIKTNPNLA